ncbi:DEAD/DEAH box helicase [Variovorax sp. HW608]|uniref:DEAD/DEAH box helicase n=1 Tax=Variovorax sp. HW608 TaxID=1034889 RepID=UPI001E4F7592|nr:DEAD/DEAH box helicase [Variovorax sp. HW608]
MRAAAANLVVAALQRAYLGQYVDLEDAGRLICAALREPQADFFTQLLDVQVFPLRGSELQRGRFAVSGLYDEPFLGAMRAMGGYFHKHASAWQVRADPSEIVQRLGQQAGIAPEFIFIHEQPVVIETLSAPSQSQITIKVPALAPDRSDGAGKEEEGAGYFSTELEREEQLSFDRRALEGLVGRGVLRDYQAVGVTHLLGQSGACLGDDMGLGKSRQVVVGLRLMAGEGRILIVCPASLRINWEREIHMIHSDDQVGIVGEDRMATLRSSRWVVANYERLGGLVKELDLTFAAMAVDEAHYLKEYDSGRTRNMFLLAARIPRRYVVTGTPLLSREVEMHTLLRMTGHRLGKLSLKDFTKEFAGSSEKRARLADALKGWMLRRSKDVLKDLGEKTRQVRYLSPAEGLGAYQDVWNDMSLMVMPKIVKLRQALEALKLQFLIETVEGLGEGDKIIIFCEYMSTVAALQEALQAIGVRAVALVGSDSLAKRQKAVDAFQGDAGVTVFIGTTSAAGVGITLTAANYVVFASLPWTPALMRQAEDRAYRLGQKRNVLVIVPLIPKTIDARVWELLQSKRETEVEVVEAVKVVLPTL